MDPHPPDQEIDFCNRQADAAWEEYRATGRCVSHAVMDAWLKTWGSDADASCPDPAP
jgi:predicted transcriptional regulator